MSDRDEFDVRLSALAVQLEALTERVHSLEANNRNALMPLLDDILGTEVRNERVLNALHDRVSALELRLDALESRMDGIEARMASLETRMTTMERNAAERHSMLMDFLNRRLPE